jgi:Undecaprenyl-phosphate glucose phosphotransferase
MSESGTAPVTGPAQASAGQPAAGPDVPLSAAAEAAAAALVTRSISRSIVSGSARLIEFVLVAAAGLAVDIAYVGSEHGLTLPYLVAIAGGALLYVFAAQLGGIYTVPALRRFVPQIGRVVGSWLFVFAALAVAAFLIKAGEDYSRAWFALWFAVGLAALIVFRILLSAQLRAWSRAGLLERRAVIVGGGEPAEKLIRALEAERDQDIRICGIFDDRKNDRSPPIVAGYPKLGTIPELVTFGRKARIDLLIVTIPISAEKRLLELLRQLWVLPVDIRLSMHAANLRFRPHIYSYVGKVPFLDVADRPIADWDVVAKWLLDKIVGTILLIFALPLMALITIAIKLDSRGPVLFTQKRYGFNNEVIEVYKFRSMYVDQLDPAALKQVTRDDPRVTRVGRFIRRTSLDELPQLFNVVFQGTLSLVGPRPHAVEQKTRDQLFEQVVDGYFARHRVKPGITGWAQVNGLRGETNTDEKLQRRVQYDFYYIDNWSVLFDLYILMITPFALFNTEHAY